ncbi:MAG TPA: NAD(P)-binding domain-containing protein [Nitrospiraceae bacterium]|nr:NAD(P)-binding domain-containing protein [Nitrospiraceae bacterium]
MVSVLESAIVVVLVDQKEIAMEIGFVGLEKMGLNMVTRLRRDGHQVVALRSQS